MPQALQLPATMRVMFFLMFFKLILFDLIWDYHTTYSSFSFLQSYVNKVSVSLVLTLPMLLFRRHPRVVIWLVGVPMDLFLMANLMYFRTYNAAIPLDSYGLVLNLADFTASVHDSLRLVDWLFFLSTLVAYLISRKTASENDPSHLLKLPLCLLAAGLSSWILFEAKGGIMEQDRSMQNANYFTVRVPVFTLFGSLYCEYANRQSPSTPADRRIVEDWLASQKSSLVNQKKRLANKNRWEASRNCLIILAESLESWPLENSIEGKEITPCLNRLLRESHTIYAPKVLSQVKGGRSIDAQLMLNTGLLPIRDGAYSVKYPDHHYPSLAKALKDSAPGAFACVMTVDKEITWNQRRVADAFGYDSLVWKKDFRLDEPVGSRKKLGDRSFLRQCGEKLTREGCWKAGQRNLIQCVTYSGHNPFVLPESLKTISFSPAIPRRMNDYLTMAHYTDQAIGDFIRQLRADDRFRNTLIVITGDHEGLASDRQALRQSAAGARYISPGKFVPLIILNAPEGFRHERVMGQIDIYPTLLELLGLDDYAWKGLGESILGGSRGFAIGPQDELVGDTAGVSHDEVRRAHAAWNVSDLLIKQDYFRGLF